VPSLVYAISLCGLLRSIVRTPPLAAQPPPPRPAHAYSASRFVRSTHGLHQLSPRSGRAPCERPCRCQRREGRWARRIDEVHARRRFPVCQNTLSPPFPCLTLPHLDDCRRRPRLREQLQVLFGHGARKVNTRENFPHGHAALGPNRARIIAWPRAASWLPGQRLHARLHLVAVCGLFRTKPLRCSSLLKRDPNVHPLAARQQLAAFALGID
jgi:hypothetical protein